MLIKLLAITCALSVVKANVFSTASNKFAAELYQKSVEGHDGNVIMSPISLQTGLSLAYFGSAGNTETEMKNGLKYDSIEKSKLLNHITTFSNTVKKSKQLNIANKIFLQEKFSIKPTYKELAKKNFDSDAEKVDFADKAKTADAINHWVESKTNHKIKNMVDAQSLDPATVMMILNAVYFKGFWRTPFVPEDTKKGEFFLNDQNTVQADFMNHKKYHGFGEFKDLHVSALELGYKNSEVKMMIVLPDTKTGLADFEQKLNTIDFIDMSSKLTDQQVIVDLPKFKIEFSHDMKTVLEKLGMRQMFTNNAEFPEMLDVPAPLKVSKVVHKAFIEVDEFGTEAGAATKIEFLLGSALNPPPPAIFKADRPFFFVLKTPTNVLFSGRVVNPVA